MPDQGLKLEKELSSKRSRVWIFQIDVTLHDKHERHSKPKEIYSKFDHSVQRRT